MTKEEGQREEGKDGVDVPHSFSRLNLIFSPAPSLGKRGPSYIFDLYSNVKGNTAHD